MVGQTRRSVLERTAKVGSVGAAATLAGCSAGGLLGGGPSLEVTGTDSQVTGWGDVHLSVSVTNSGSESGSDTLYGQVDVEGGDVYSQSRQVTVPGGQTNEYSLQFDIQFSDSLSASGYETDAWIETAE